MNRIAGLLIGVTVSAHFNLYENQLKYEKPGNRFFFGLPGNYYYYPLN
jgi:hypothetical protein